MEIQLEQCLTSTVKKCLKNIRHQGIEKIKIQSLSLLSIIFR